MARMSAQPLKIRVGRDILRRSDEGRLQGSVTAHCRFQRLDDQLEVTCVTTRREDPAPVPAQTPEHRQVGVHHYSRRQGTGGGVLLRLKEILHERDGSFDFGDQIAQKQASSPVRCVSHSFSGSLNISSQSRRAETGAI